MEYPGPLLVPLVPYPRITDIGTMYLGIHYSRILELYSVLTSADTRISILGTRLDMAVPKNP